MASNTCCCGHIDESHAWAPILGKRTACLVTGCTCGAYIHALDITEHVALGFGGRNLADVAPYVDRFDDILKEMSELHNKKGKDYGGTNDPYANVRASEEFGVPAWVGALLRMNDKVTRLKAFIRNGDLANESALDSITDIAVYAVIMRILYDEQEVKPSS